MSIIWSWQVIRSFPRLQAENILFAWSDFFVHASLLARFTHYPAFNAPVLFSYGARIPLYHWASYMLPAAVCGFSHVPALVVATTLWVVFGHVLMALGAWALGAILADWLGGAAAMVLILMVPNASHYGLRDHFLDFAWMLQISSSLSYGLGFCLLSVGLCVVAVRKQSRITLSAAVALALAEATFKVHLFLLLAPTCSVFLLLLWPRVERRTRLIYFGGLAGIALLLAAVGERIRYAPHLFRGPHKVRQILHSMLDMPPSAAPNLFPAIEAATPHFVAVLLGLLLVLVAASGLLLPFYFGVWAYGRRRDLNRPEDCFPALLLAAYCLLILIFPTSVYKGAAEEYQHRNFVLIFAVLSVWCGVFAVRLLNRWQPARAAMVVAGCACLLLPAPLLLQKTVQTNVMPWCRSYVENTVPRGLLQSALYLRQAGSPRDIVFASEWRQDVVLTSLSEKPTLLAEGLLYKNEAIAHRAEVEKQLKSVRSFDEMVRIGREQAIGWYMASPSAPMPPDIRQHAASCVDGYCVIQLRP